MATVLWVTAETPDRGLGGGQIRGSYLLEALARRTDVHLVTAGPLRDEVLREVVAEVTEVTAPAAPPKSQPTWARRAREVRDALLSRDAAEVRSTRAAREALRDALVGITGAKVGFVMHSGAAGLRSALPAERAILDLQHLLSRQAEHAMTIAPARRHKWLADRELRKARRLERWASGAYDLVTVASAEDAAVLPRPPAIVPNGVDVRRFDLSPLTREPRLLFSGSVSWRPNVDAAVWLCTQVLPAVRAAVPDVTLDIVGLNPVAEVTRLASSSVRIHDVPDVLPFLTACRVALVPVRIGSGTRVKALEAMAAGRPLAGTTIGLEGLALEDGVSAAIADDAPGLAHRITRLLVDDAMADAQVRAARQLVDDRFRWEDIGPAFADLVLNGAG